MDQTPSGDSPSKKREIIATLAVLIVVVVIVGAIAITSKKKASNTVSAATPSASTTPSQTTTVPEPSAPSATASSFKDGSYSATGSYDSPGGQESITVTVALKDGVITDTSAESGANDSEAEEYQGQFIAAYKQLVVGKKITSVSLSRVSGSSLTSQGFNSAIQKIQSEAKV